MASCGAPRTAPPLESIVSRQTVCLLEHSPPKGPSFLNVRIVYITCWPKMLTIRQRHASSGRSAPALLVPPDDYTFHAVLACGRVISKPNKKLFTEAYDLATSDDGHAFVFELTVLEASRLMDLYPSFGHSGLPGQWCLQSGRVRLVKALEPAGGPYDASKVAAFLLDNTSCAFVRSRYATALDQNKWSPLVLGSSPPLLA